MQECLRRSVLLLAFLITLLLATLTWLRLRDPRKRKVAKADCRLPTENENANKQMHQEKTNSAGCVTWGLTALALLLGFLSLIGRADSMDDLSRGKIFGVIILGPVGGGAVFMHMYSRFADRRNGKVIAVAAGLIVWALSALVATAWEQKKVDIRLRSLRQMQERIETIPEPAAAPYR